MNQPELNKLANSLLKLHGFGTDGAKLKWASKKQRFFEMKTIITTPMGNRR